MRILLAPMEGVVDHTVRDMLSQIGGIDRCVTEFVRVTTHPLPPRVFHRYCPELGNGGKTPCGTPVFIQLLGGNPELLAASAVTAAELGAPGIDINFGCPTKLVNRNDGGSVILKEPRRLFDIVSAVRAAVPDDTPVTAKIRLGFHDRSLLTDITQAIFDANASELCIHARTRDDSYRPPAYWDAIADVASSSPIPIIANGEIWNLEDYQRCVQASGCSDVMLGRGALSCPDLARQIKAFNKTEMLPTMPWSEVVELIANFCTVTEQMYNAKHVGNRIKQWLSYLRRQYTEAEHLFESVKRLKWPDEIAAVLHSHRLLLDRR